MPSVMYDRRLQPAAGSLLMCVNEFFRKPPVSFEQRNSDDLRKPAVTLLPVLYP